MKRHLNKSNVHLNKDGTMELPKNICEFLLQLDRYSTDNKDNISSGNEIETVFESNKSKSEHDIHQNISQSDFFCNSGHKCIS